MVACDAWTAKESVTGVTNCQGGTGFWGRKMFIYTLEEGITICVQSLQRSKGSISKWI